MTRLWSMKWLRQIMFKVPYNCAHLMCQQGYSQNLSNEDSWVHELKTSRCTKWVFKRQRNQRSNCQHSLDHRKSKRISEKNIYFCFIDYTKAFDCVNHNSGKFLKRWEYQTTLPASCKCMQVRKQENWIWNTRLVQNWESSMSGLCIITLLI